VEGDWYAVCERRATWCPERSDIFIEEFVASSEVGATGSTVHYTVLLYVGRLLPPKIRSFYPGFHHKVPGIAKYGMTHNLWRKGVGGRTNA
jgi:hypothetical protein